MMRLLPAAALVLLAATTLAGAERTVLIVAGQSNVLNWHADAAQLPPAEADGRIAFYYHTGAPPSKGGAEPFNATSGGKWTTLRPQRQEPFVRYARDFFGPEISLARTLDARGAGPLAIIKVGYFGSNLAEDWRPGATAGNRLYGLLQAEVQRALRALAAAGESPRVAGFFWFQGETDAASAGNAAAYGRNLAAFIARVRADFGDASAAAPLPVILARVGPRPASGYVYQEVVRTAQVQVAAAGVRLAWVDTDDLPRDTDGIHLLAPGVLTLGERWAGAWQALHGAR